MFCALNFCFFRGTLFAFRRRDRSRDGPRVESVFLQRRVRVAGFYPRTARSAGLSKEVYNGAAIEGCPLGQRPPRPMSREFDLPKEEAFWGLAFAIASVI